MKFFASIILFLPFVLQSVQCSSRGIRNARSSSGSNGSEELKKTQLSRYVGMAPVEPDYDTDDTPSCSTEDEEDEQGIFPLIVNTGNTCAFDSLLQTLLILEFKPFKRLNVCKSTQPFVQALVNRFGKEKEAWISHLLLHLKAFSRKFEEYYGNDRPRLEMPGEMVHAHVRMFAARYDSKRGYVDRMADPSEVADFFLEMLNEEEAAGLEWQWTTLLDGRESRQERTKMLILRATNETKLQVMLDRHLNHNAHQVEWRDDRGLVSLVEKRSVFTKIPALQIFLLQRTWRSHQRLSSKSRNNPKNKPLVRTNFLSQRSIDIPLQLPAALGNGSFKAAICVNTKSVPHYFVVLRDVDPEDGEEYFTIYDGIRDLPKVVPASFARVLINRMSLMLFFVTKSNQINQNNQSHQSNQINQSNQSNQRDNQINQINQRDNQMNQSNRSNRSNQSNQSNQMNHSNQSLHHNYHVDDFADEDEYLAFVIQTLGQ